MGKVSRAERAPRMTFEGMGLKATAAVLLIGAAGLLGALRAGKISDLKDRIDYSAGQAKAARQIAVDLKKLKCHDVEDANNPSFSRSEAKLIRKAVNQKDTGNIWIAGSDYRYRTGRSDAWAHPVWLSASGSLNSRFDSTYLNALVDTVDQTRQLDLGSTQPDDKGKLPIQRFRLAYARNAQDELADAIRHQNHQTRDELYTIYNMGEGFTSIPGVDFVLSAGNLPGISQLSDVQAQSVGLDAATYDKYGYDNVIGVAFDPVKPDCR